MFWIKENISSVLLIFDTSFFLLLFDPEYFFLIPHSRLMVSGYGLLLFFFVLGLHAMVAPLVLSIFVSVSVFPRSAAFGTAF